MRDIRQSIGLVVEDDGVAITKLSRPVNVGIYYPVLGVVEISRAHFGKNADPCPSIRI